MGLEYAGLSQTRFNNPVKGFFCTLFSVLKCPFTLHKRDILVVQYPFKKYYKLICRLAHLRGAKVVTVIHDLGCFRRKRLSPKGEIRRLNHSDYIIAHNQVMAQWLHDNGCRAKISSLGIFDYLARATPQPRPDTFKPVEIIYVGSLRTRKTTFLYDWLNKLTAQSQMHVALYGNDFEPQHLNADAPVDYKGFVAHEKLIATVSAHFGLVWDGDSVDTCSGNFGEYLRINNPHKASLYLRCGIPVIVWKQAAMRHIINDFHAGIAVESLSELPDILSKMTEEEYQHLREGAARLGALIAQGHFIQQALLSFRFRFGSDGRHYV
ncbi:MAG: galactofuranosyltransferase [Muribaculaceae bacterium]